MNIKDVKIGETYNVRVRVKSITDCGINTFTVQEDGACIFHNYFSNAELAAFSSINPYEPLKLDIINRIPETDPKFDPCRPFKKGDIVEIDTRGRDIAEKAGVELGVRYTVTVDERKNGYVSFKGDDGIEQHAMFFWLKLVTPVEEPYFIEKGSNGYRLMKSNGKLLANYWETHPHAKETAEAERDRLNAEYRQSTINNQQ